MDSGLAHQTSKGRNPQVMKTAGFLSLTLALIATCAAGSLLAYQEFHESRIEPPDITLVHDRGQAAKAMLLIHPEPNINQVQLTATVQLKDIHDWTQHMANAATARGWFPYDARDGILKIILPKNELHILQNATQNPYAWLEQNRRSRAAPLKTGEHPILATVKAEQETSPSVIWLLIAVFSALTAITTGTIAFVRLTHP